MAAFRTGHYQETPPPAECVMPAVFSGPCTCEKWCSSCHASHVLWRMPKRRKNETLPAAECVTPAVLLPAAECVTPAVFSGPRMRKVQFVPRRPCPAERAKTAQNARLRAGGASNKGTLHPLRTAPSFAFLGVDRSPLYRRPPRPKPQHPQHSFPILG